MNSGTTGSHRTLGSALAALALAGCAAPGGAPPPPGPDYVPGSGYHMVMAEIAAQRGARAVAAEEYLNAAERSDDPELSQRAAQFAFQNGFDTYALRAARRWSQLDPQETSARLYITRLLVRRNDIAGAAPQAEAALGPAAGRSAEDYALFADELAAEDNTEGVTRLLSRIAARAPDVPALQLALGSAALRSQDLDLALESGRAVASLADETLGREADALVGRALFSLGEQQAALDYLRRQAEAHPGLDMDLEYAGLLAADDRHGEALAFIEEMSARHEDVPAARRLRALVNLQADELKAAWEDFSALTEDSEFADEAFYRMAEIAVRQQRFDQALQLFAQVGGGPYLLPAQDAISRIAEASGDAQSALDLLAGLGRRHPEVAFEADGYRAAMLQRMGRNEEALALLNDMLRYRPDDAALRLTRGALLEKLGRAEEALADMEAAVAILPDSAVTMNALGYTLVNHTGRNKEAYALIRRALERQPDSAAIMDSYGWVLYRFKRLAEARSYLDLAYADLSDPEVAAHLGEVMWRQGEREAARRLWADALEKSPDSAPLKDTMARLIR